MKEQHAIRALDRIPRAKAWERAPFEVAAGRDGNAQFVLKVRETQGRMATSPDREEYFPVSFVESYEGSEVARGFDLAANSVRRKASLANGIVLDLLRRDERTKLIPVVILTSSDDDNDIARRHALGVNSFVRKPVDFAASAKAAREPGLYWLILNEAPPAAR